MLFKKSDPPAGQSAANGRRAPREKESLRETLESIVFAFVLAFLFRTFEAEAFVIPTGSMAPTLYGRHKEQDCEQCGYHFVIGASDEVDDEYGYLKPNTRISTGVCPNCRFENENAKNALAFNGDRILVSKYPYEFSDPQRWDVFVFKFPEEPKTNYIKRLVGLPNETIRIRDGDIFLVDEQGGAQIQRKDPAKQRAIQIVVHDNDYAAHELLKAGWPERWAAALPPGDPLSDDWQPTETGWSQGDDRSFRLQGRTDSGPEDTLHWLRYRHFVPAPDDWADFEAGQPLQAQPQLITDFCGYNAFTGSFLENPSVEHIDFGYYWVNDLTANCDVVVERVDAGAEIVLEMREGIYWYRCHIDLGTGRAKLTEINLQMDPTEEREIASADTSMAGTGEWSIAFANVDDRLCLWVDGDLVEFGPEAAYHRDALSHSGALRTDLTPVGIAAKNCDVSVSHLRVDRDIYYRVDYPAREDGRQMIVERTRNNLARNLTDPERWSELYAEHALTVAQRDLVLGPDEFLAFGDNSPRSRDSRLWELTSTVPRDYLVGRAFWIYWPHGVPFLNGGRGFAVTHHSIPGQGKVDYPKFSVPFYPQVWRMNRIR